MTDSKALISLIKQSGLKMKYLAERLGLSKYGFHLKVHGKRSFNQFELITLCDILCIRDFETIKSIFFAEEVDEQIP